MTTGKVGTAPPPPPPPPPPRPSSVECCMCGDYGLSSELFKCKVCQFRSQHRYCSNQYPKAETYRVCNWCLSQSDDTTTKTDQKAQNSSNPSSSISQQHRNNNNTEGGNDQVIMIKKKKKIGGSDINLGGLKGRKSNLQLQVNSSPIKKQRSPSPSLSPAARKRIVSGGGVEERLRRTKSEEMSNGGGISKQVFRNKVRRYKLLDEVSSQ